MTILPRCLCGHGPSRHYHLDGTSACRLCTTCASYRRRCTALAYPKPNWPDTCTRRAVEGSSYCRQHAKMYAEPRS